MSDQELIDRLLLIGRTPQLAGPFVASPEWREYRDCLSDLLAELNARLDAADAAELEEAERRVAELKSRLGKPAPAPYASGLIAAVEGADAPVTFDPSKLTPQERAKLKWSETDAGRMGAGRVDMDDGTTAEEFAEELRDLRLQTAEKRRKLR